MSNPQNDPMPFDLSDTLVVGISSTALFDLAEADAVFTAKERDDPDSAIEEYRQYTLDHEEQLLSPGTGFPLVKALLRLNRHTAEGDAPIVEVVVMSRNSPETGVRVLKSLRAQDLGISRSAFTGGESVTDYLEAFDVDLFLTTRPEDAQSVIDSDVCAAALLSPPPRGTIDVSEEQVRIAFDGDAVLFSDESEIVYKTKGLAAFHRNEHQLQDVPLDEGPYASLLRKLGRVQDRLPMRMEYSPVRIAIVTARSSPAEMRVISTLRKWGVYVDCAFFLGGLEKSKVLRAFKPHIYFDDQEIHLRNAAVWVPSGRVPYRSTSVLATVPEREGDGRLEDDRCGPRKDGTAGNE